MRALMYLAVARMSEATSGILETLSPHIASVMRATVDAFPGCCAARSGALLIRGPHAQCVWVGPGSAKQRFTLHRVRDTSFIRRLALAPEIFRAPSRAARKRNIRASR